MPIIVAGLGFAPEHIPSQVKKLIARATLIAAGQSNLELIARDCGPIAAPCLALDKDLAKTFEALWAEHTRDGTALLLASGDPLFFGAASTLRNWLRSAYGREALHDLHIIPNISSLQAMAARLGLDWSDLPCVSLHGRTDWFPLWQALAQARSSHICLLTDNVRTPAHVANALITRGCEDSLLHIFSRLGSDAEDYACLPLKEARNYNAPDPNALILERIAAPGQPLVFGRDDASFINDAGLMTKGPARAVAIAALRLEAGQTLWDLGAGSGAVGLEAAALLPRGRIFAVERDAARANMIFDNRRLCGAWHLEIIHAELPGGLSELPDPDRIFIGGGLETDKAGVPPDSCLAVACDRLKPGGRLVVNCVLQSSLQAALAYFRQISWPVETTLLQAAQSRPLGGSEHFAAQNPVFILAAAKPE